MCLLSLARASGKPADRSIFQRAELKGLFMVHNVLLSVGSGLLLAVMLEEVSSQRAPGSRRGDLS